MKKFFLIACIAAFATCASAQNDKGQWSFTPTVTVSTWRWLNEGQGLRMHSWNNSLEDLTGVMNGQATASFKGLQMSLVEETSQTEDGYTLETNMTYTLNEVK